ncbi:uncharacterized protein [Drosophila takahashii]|uniref:uncharacterized protein n=1 Tax=Drosophila takahashii TaxID=29030 RepID=UPI001CF851A9|nr:uncharacterized protein LOC108065281 [Drosophila takahashii]
MLFKTVTLLLAIGAVYVAAVPTPTEIETEASMINLLLNTPAMRADVYNVDCMEHYTPLLKGHVDKYTDDFNACQYKYDNGQSEIDESFKGARDELTISVKDTCISLITCDGKTSNSDAFDCLAIWGPSASKELEQASYKATDNNTSLKRKVSEIEQTRAICQTEAHRTYIKNHGECYNEMISCLNDPDWDIPTTDSAL